MTTARVFPRGCIASPHHLASAAGQAVLAGGGNAIDAAVAANLVLGVVTPYHCGVGGDLLAIVWDGSAHGVVSVGAAPAGATPDAIRAAIDAGHGDPEVSFPGRGGMPMFGALPVTVPGAVAGWQHLLDGWGTRSFGATAAAAVGFARDGFVVSPHGAEYAARAPEGLAAQPGWADSYGRMRGNERFVQVDLAATLEAIAADGPDVVYRGPIGERIVATLQERGSTMTIEDLAAHRVAEVDPLQTRYRGVDVLELPPPTQGVTALTALAVLESLGPLPDDPALATHLQVEAIRLALADREEHLADPDGMHVGAQDLLDPARIERLAAGIDRQRAGSWPPARPLPGGTAYLCAADGDGLLVSLIQSNFVGFGSGVVVPGTGIGLHDRGAHFSLVDGDPNAIAPRKRPLHTLIPALALRDGEPWLVFGTMGGDGQAQTHVQVLGNLLDHGAELQAAVTAPRWVVDPADGSLAIESRADRDLVAELRARGHEVSDLGAYDYAAGHAHAIEVLRDGYAGATDPRCEGAITGC